LGLCITNGINEQSDRIFVIRIKNKSPAGNAKLINAGDELIKINDQPVRGMNHREVSEIMVKYKGSKLTLTLAKNNKQDSNPNSIENIKDKDSPTSVLKLFPRTTSLRKPYSVEKMMDQAFLCADSDNLTPSGFKGIQTVDSFDDSYILGGNIQNNNKGQENLTKIVTLKKTKNGYGFSFVGGLTANRALPFYIQTLSLGGAAINSKKIKPGDKIIEINGIALYGMDHAAVVKLIKSEEELTLVIQSK
ncbi:hypothetical protein MXB_2456, partial [Myxobolus squamalis]